jgi:hypothetical protein
MNTQAMIYDGHGKREVFQVVVDDVPGFCERPIFAKLVLGFIDHIEQMDDGINCFVCGSKIGPGHYLLGEVIMIIQIISTKGVSAIYGTCPDCSEKYDVARMAFDNITALPGMRRIDIHQEIGRA